MLVKPRYEKHMENISRFGTPLNVISRGLNVIARGLNVIARGLNVIARGWGNTLVSLGSACFKTLTVRKKR